MSLGVGENVLFLCYTFLFFEFFFLNNTFFFFLIYYLFYLSILGCLAVLGLRCCVRAFSSCGEREILSLWCTGFSLWWLLLLWSTGCRCAGFISSCGSWALERRLSSCGARAPWHVGSSRTRAQTRVPCIGRRILTHWATREALFELFVSLLSHCIKPRHLRSI